MALSGGGTIPGTPEQCPATSAPTTPLQARADLLPQVTAFGPGYVKTRDQRVFRGRLTIPDLEKTP